MLPRRLQRERWWVVLLFVSGCFLLSRLRLATRPSLSYSSSLLHPPSLSSPTRASLAHLQAAPFCLPASFRYSCRHVQMRFADSASEQEIRGIQDIRESPGDQVDHRRVIRLGGPLVPPATTVYQTPDGGGSPEEVRQGQPGPEPQLPACQPLVLHVTRPYPELGGSSGRRRANTTDSTSDSGADGGADADASADAGRDRILFGLSSTHGRLRRSLDGFAHWLGGTKYASLVAIINEDGTAGDDHDVSGSTSLISRPLSSSSSSSSSSLRVLEALYEQARIRLHATHPHNRSLSIAQNHFAVLALLLERASPHTHWLALIDDDTFFPSLFRLDAALQQHNHSTPLWLGALSEDFDAVAAWGYMAYGGAGIFLSVPLARQLVVHLDDCLHVREQAQDKSPSRVTGDGILRDCLYRHTTTKLTLLPGLYQHDLYGNLAGFYESGILPLSVHHWRSWYHLPLPAMAAIGRLCGDCFLQRWAFVSGDRTADTLLANGFSVTQYPQGLGAYDLSLMESTWSRAGNEFDFSLGPLRSALDRREKKSYQLADTLVDASSGALRQVYIYRGDFLIDEPDEVFEMVWGSN